MKNTEKCAQLLSGLRAAQSKIKVVVAHGALPLGAKYVMVKADAATKRRVILGDGSLQGLFLEESGEVGTGLRVMDVSDNGIFARAKINKRCDILFHV